MNNEKYTKLGKVTIIDKEDKKIVAKEKKEDSNIKGLYNYLTSRDFYTFPELIDTDEKSDYYEFLSDTDMPIEQRAQDLINITSLLHHKTTYFKEVREDKFKEIYDNIDSNINYLKNYNDNLYSKFFKEKYMSPSKYLYMKNYYKINAALDFCKNELDEYYELVKKEKKQRVSVIHNDLKVDHYLKSDKEALISWDKSKIDTPILDIINLYQNDYLKYDFSSLLEIYNNRYPLLDHEKKLLFIIINLPPKITFDLTEFENVKLLRSKLDYIYKTEQLTKPYYSSDEEEQ